MGSANEALGETSRAQELWSKALRRFDQLGNEQHRGRLVTAMRTAKARPAQAKVPVAGWELSEYEVPAHAALQFVVGEVWAALHARGRWLYSLSHEHITFTPSGLPRVSPAAHLAPFFELDSEAGARDLLSALSHCPDQLAGALLAGYVRGGYELIDPKVPGYVNAVLDRLEIRGPRPQPAEAPIDLSAILEALGVEVCVARSGVELQIVAQHDPTIWRRAPRDVFETVLALLIAGVDCARLFERDRAAQGSNSELYRVLFPEPPSLQSAADDARVAELAPGFELAVGLARVLRNLRLSEPFDFNQIIYWVRRGLTAGSEAQAMRLGDIVLAVIRRCEAALTTGSPAPFALEAYTQRGVILLEYVSRGRRTDEGRLIACTRSLHALPGFPRPFEAWGDAAHLGLLNSWGITLRELAEKAANEQERGRPGMLRSASLRGLPVARHTLRRAFEAASSRDPEVATPGLAFMRVAVKNHANLLLSLARSAEHDERSSRSSPWLAFFRQGSTPSHLGRELTWMTSFLEAAATEGFSLDAARPFMREGWEFLAPEHTFAPPPPCLGTAPGESS